MICNCKEVSEIEIIKFLKKHPNATFNDIRVATGASTGCGRCSLSVRMIINEQQSQLKPEQQFKLPFEN